ncbi:MAG: head GIN domain-containing protein [Prevotella sp.]
MKKLFVFVAAVFTLVSCSFSATVDDTIVEEDRAVQTFTQIQIMGSPTVVYTQGNKCSVRVKAPKDMIKKISTVCKGNRLEIETKGGINFWGFKGDSYDKVTVYVTSPDITGVELNGSGDFKSDNPIDTDNIYLTVRGSGDISVKGRLICDNAQLQVTGSGDLEVENLEALTNNVVLIGSGDLEVRQRNVKDTKVQLTGSGDIKVDCDRCDKLESQLTGSGDISIRGTVKRFNKMKAGSGSYKISIVER